jgi:hypothetical protein
MAGAPTAVLGVAITGAGATTGLAGSILKMNAANNRDGGYNRGNRTDASNNERHGDGGRAQAKANKKLSDLQNQLSNATTKKEKIKIRNRMKNIVKDAEKKRNGEEHSRGIKR